MDFMPRCILSPAAQRDIESNLAWTHEQFSAWSFLCALVACNYIGLHDAEFPRKGYSMDGCFPSY
jgi:hypothetical protein